MKPLIPVVFASAACLALAGCAGGTQCMTAVTMGVSPLAATADSTAKAPANQQQFQASTGITLVQQGSGSCAIPALRALVHPQWTSSDPAHVSISSADDASNGLATCLGSAGSAVTLTATLPAGNAGVGTSPTPLTATAQLTCR